MSQGIRVRGFRNQLELDPTWGVSFAPKASSMPAVHFWFSYRRDQISGEDETLICVVNPVAVFPSGMTIFELEKLAFYMKDERATGANLREYAQCLGFTADAFAKLIRDAFSASIRLLMDARG